MKKLVGFLLVVIAVLAVALCSGRVCNCDADAESTDAERAALSDVIDGDGA